MVSRQGVRKKSDHKWQLVVHVESEVVVHVIGFVVLLGD